MEKEDTTVSMNVQNCTYRLFFFIYQIIMLTEIGQIFHTLQGKNVEKIDNTSSIPINVTDNSIV